ncbi:MAG: hypothetical protein U1F98_00375 [Verrucomicrobiota bacterium]
MSIQGVRCLLLMSAFARCLTGLAQEEWQTVATGYDFTSATAALGRRVATANSGIGGAVFYSDDGIRWFQSGSGSTNGPLNAVAYGNGLFVAAGGVGSRSAILTSASGADWAPVFLGVSLPISAVVHGGSGFVAFPGSATLLSADGTNWAWASPGIGRSVSAACWGAGQYVAAGPTGGLFVSPDGQTWTQTYTNAGALTDVAYGNGLFIAVCSNSVLTSLDAIHWGVNPLPVSNAIGVGCGAGTFAISGSQGTILTSSDGTNWLAQSAVATNRLSRVLCSGGRINLFGANGSMLSSTDTTNWALLSVVPAVATENFAGLTYGNGTWVALRNTSANTAGRILVSTNQTVWTESSLGRVGALRDIIYGNGLFVAVGNDGAYVSTNGYQWAPAMTGVALAGVTWGIGQFVACSSIGYMVSKDGTNWAFSVMKQTATTRLACGNGVYVATEPTSGKIFSSQDATNWVLQSTTPGNTYWGLAFANGQFVAVGCGASAAITTSVDGTNWFIRMTSTNTCFSVSGGDGVLATAAYPLNIPGKPTSWIYTSRDGTNWTGTSLAGTNRFDAMIYADRRFVAGGVGGDVLLSAPLISLAAAALPGQPLQLSVLGPANQPIAIDASAGMPVWTVLTNTHTGANGWAVLTDNTSTNQPQRFYRASTPF